MDELKLVSAAMMDRGCFNLVNKYIQEKDVTPEGQRLLRSIKEYYERDPEAKNCDRELIQETVIASFPEHMEKAKEAFSETFKRIPREVSPDNISKYIVSVKKEQAETDLVTAMLQKEDPKKLGEMMEKWRDLVTTDILMDESPVEIYTGWDVEDLVKNHHDIAGLIKVLPVKLNDQIDGGGKPGHQFLVFAPTEMGKSAFCLNLAYGFLKQNLRVLYIGNEDPIADLDMRLINRFTAMTKQEVRADPRKAADILGKTAYRNFTIAGLAPGTFPEIKELTKDYNPHVVVLDQMANINIPGVDGQTQQLLGASKAARQLGKSEGRLIVSVAQAADNAYGKLILHRNDVQWSNVDVPGQMDLMLGIGGDEAMEIAGTRRISKPKNKLSGDHSYLDVLLQKQYSKVTEL